MEEKSVVCHSGKVQVECNDNAVDDDHHHHHDDGNARDASESDERPTRFSWPQLAHCGESQPQRLVGFLLG